MYQSTLFFSPNESQTEKTGNLLEGDFTLPLETMEQPKVDDSKPSSALLDLNWSTTSDFLSGDFMPSKLIQDNLFNIVQENPIESNSENSNQKAPTETTKENQVSWLSLFAELDPLANNPLDDVAGNRV